MLPKGLEQIVEETGLPMPEVMECLLHLQLIGMVREASKNRYVRTRLEPGP